ncbi:MAG: type II toxin-antitoxin system RelE/ParE family toxin [Rhizobiaceae bacterium]|nr:type II toxin-antitoxin system RelE/ParE family toxin [Rhizobiaceae bacterium]
MNLVWTGRAKDDLREIVSYIAADNLPAARKMMARIERLAAYLQRQPFMGRPGVIPGTREAIPHPSYRIVYEVSEEAVIILAVVHTARQWPPEGDIV